MDQKFLQVETREEAEQEAPWAAEIIQVEGGFMVFKYLADVAIWRSAQ